jgi:predicted transcriptional regulator
MARKAKKSQEGRVWPRKGPRAARSKANKSLYREVREGMRDERKIIEGREATMDDVSVIIDAIAAGDTLKGKARELGVNEATIRNLIARDAEASTRYARARLEQAHSLVEQSVEDLDTLERIDSAADGASVEVSKFKHKFEVRRWLAGKLHVGAYGDKVTAILEGGEKPIRTINEQMSVDEASRVFADERAKKGE